LLLWAIEAQFSTGPNWASVSCAFLCLLLLDRCTHKFCGGVLFCVRKEDGSGEHLKLCRSAAALRGGAQREIRSVEMKKKGGAK
ncbi:MAG: hypothetical protein KH440_11135, partial [Oscillospiraceae bacterium]|nr:hypothetical protein [Oscillospiraceae bacterium]